MNHSPTSNLMILRNVRNWNLDHASENIYTANAKRPHITDDVREECRRNSTRQFANAYFIAQYIFFNENR